jgi:hypothetical protein
VRTRPPGTSSLVHVFVKVIGSSARATHSHLVAIFFPLITSVSSPLVVTLVGSSTGARGGASFALKIS